MKRRLGIAIVAVVTAVGLFVLVTLPSATVQLPVTQPATTAVGAYHVHTTRSDGSGTVDEVARAAAEAGLQFVILTDHLTEENGSLLPEPPRYHAGVLVIDAMEVSTREGHLVALGLSGPPPYPLGGEARDVMEDVTRLGGWSVVAHPDSPKPDLRWRGRAGSGVEWINADSEWRDNSPGRLVQVALHSLVRPAPAIASLFARPHDTMARWERAARTRPVVGLAAVDAHARIGLDERSEPRVARTLLARPAYVDMFRTLVQAVWLEHPLTGDAGADAAAVLDAMRAGQTYSAVTALATPAVLSVTADASQIRASVAGAPEAIVSIWHAGRQISAAPVTTSSETSSPGLYRVEVQWPGAEVPWMVSAPLYVPPVTPPGTTPSEAPAHTGTGPVLQTIPIAPDSAWVVEHHPATTATWRHDDAITVFTYTLARGTAPGQYAALVSALDASQSFEEISFTVSADRPMRFSVQVRLPDASGGGERWVRSVYAEPTPRTVRLRLEEFEPAGRPTTRRPVAARLQSLLFVVDAPHTLPGTSGTMRVSNVALHAATPQAALRSER